MRFLFYWISALAFIFNIFCALYWPNGLYSLYVIVPLFIVGLRDIFQSKQAIRKNFPVLGNFRYLLEMIRPEINQYFIESNTDGTPINRENRSVVYQRAKKVTDTIPFGTQHDVYREGYEFLPHSLTPKKVALSDLRTMIGGPFCKKPYSASIFNISAMSYGSLSQNAILALNGGAKDGEFAHNTGEGGLSSWHEKNGGDLIWQIGTGYFGCRDAEGNFNGELFAEKSAKPQVKMIEIKLSQGAKPGHGGILPKGKVTEEIAKIRNVPMGKDVISPPGHSAFSNPKELLQFVSKLRELSGGKPIGIKLCIGREEEFISLCKAMVETKIYVDYVSVDGGEGGTGAAPLEFSNSMGMPGTDALVFVVNCLRGFGLKKDIRVLCSGKLTTAFGIIRLMCLGADVLYAARPFMLSLGCIQALRCNTNDCPTGVATQDPKLVSGLVVTDKRERVKNFHSQTLHAVAEMIGAMGLTSHDELKPYFLRRRLSHFDVRSWEDLVEWVPENAWLEHAPKKWANKWDQITSEKFN
ncbi:MAG: FMN-binding glutamate synthase family protein [Bacteriovoracaceae bacterium]|nr:FMN-binding glutamate synthase family protein [Bacteriovoracaceae bacterium]